MVYGSSMYLGLARTWLRYIDNILMVWAGSTTELIAFMDELDHNSRNIHLTFVADPHEILDWKMVDC